MARTQWPIIGHSELLLSKPILNTKRAHPKGGIYGVRRTHRATGEQRTIDCRIDERQPKLLDDAKQRTNRVVPLFLVDSSKDPGPPKQLGRVKFLKGFLSVIGKESLDHHSEHGFKVREKGILDNHSADQHNRTLGIRAGIVEVS
jgi:hypothetical protein